VLGAVPRPGSPAGRADQGPGRFDGMVLTVWSISAGHVEGVEVSDLVVVSVGDRRTEPAWQLLLIDEAAGPEQLRGLVAAFQGRLGGPLRDLAAPGAGDLGFYQLSMECTLEEGGQTIAAPPWVCVWLVAVPGDEGSDDAGRAPEPSPLGTGGSCWTVDSVSWATGGFVSWPERGLEWDFEGCTGGFCRFRIES